jgi:hypothetical protein
MRKPFDIIAEGLSHPEWLPRLGDFRNWLLESSEVQILKMLFKTALPAHPGHPVSLAFRQDDKLPFNFL